MSSGFGVPKDAMSVVIARPSSSIELAMSLENNASVTISHRERHHFVVDVEVFPLSHGARQRPMRCRVRRTITAAAFAGAGDGRRGL